MRVRLDGSVLDEKVAACILRIAAQLKYFAGEEPNSATLSHRSQSVGCSAYQGVRIIPAGQLGTSQSVICLFV